MTRASKLHFRFPQPRHVNRLQHTIKWIPRAHHIYFAPAIVCRRNQQIINTQEGQMISNELISNSKFFSHWTNPSQIGRQWMADAKIDWSQIMSCWLAFNCWSNLNAWTCGGCNLMKKKTCQVISWPAQCFGRWLQIIKCIAVFGFALVLAISFIVRGEPIASREKPLRIHKS